jgi:hypothetical protein
VVEERDWNRNWDVKESLRALGCAFVHRPLGHLRR